MDDGEARANLANVHRRLDYLMAHGRPLPRAPIRPEPVSRRDGPCQICGATACASPSCLRAILAAEEQLALRQRLAQHASVAERDAAARRNGHGRA